MARSPLQQTDPARVGRYRLTARLGAGGMGVVYLGETQDGYPVAIKVLRPELADNPEFRTRFGREMRATAQDPDTAGLVGVPAPAVYAQATAIAVGTATLAGVFLGIHASFAPSSGPTQLIFAFEAVVIGGLGSLWGTLVGGIVLGIAQTLGALIDPQYSILAGHIVFLVVLASPRGQLLWRRRAAGSVAA